MDKSTGWRERLARAGYKIEGGVDGLRYRMSERFRPDRVKAAQPYRWYGTPEKVTVRGRAMHDNGLLGAQDDDSRWDNLLNAYRRFNSDEIPFADVTVRIGAQSHVVQADDEGYFELTVGLDAPLAAGWHSAEISLADGPAVDAPILVVDDSAEFGIISDVDDTILQTHATNLLRVAQLTLLGNARTRLAFDGVAAFYQALSKEGKNPIFYVSSSPWNLYDLLNDFIEMQGIPPGPLCLRDLGIDRNKLITTGHGSHKLKQIEGIMNTYPHLAFVLVGDSGQHDPEIYSELAHRHPDRIKAIYIRDVDDSKRDASVNALAETTKAAGIDMLLVSNSLVAAQHAAANAWIEPTQLAGVAAEIQDRDDLLTL